MLTAKDIQYRTKSVPAAWNKRLPYCNNSTSLLSLTFYSSLESQFASARGRKFVTVSSFVEIGQTASEIWRFFEFPRWRPLPSWIFNISNFNGRTAEEGWTASICQVWSKSIASLRRYEYDDDFSIFPRWRQSAVLDLFCECLDHPRRALGGLYHCVKFGWNRSSNVDNMQVLVFCDFSLKTPIHAPFWVFGGTSPQMSLIVLTPKRTILRRNHVIWAIKHEYRPHDSSWVLEEEKTDRAWQEKKSQNGYISPIWGEAPTDAIYIKNCVPSDVLNVITCAKF